MLKKLTLFHKNFNNPIKQNEVNNFYMVSNIHLKNKFLCILVNVLNSLSTKENKKGLRIVLEYNLCSGGPYGPQLRLRLLLLN